MGIKLLILFIFVLSLCFCIYNWWFLRERNRRRSRETQRKQRLLDRHTFWGTAALLLLFSLLAFLAYEIAILYLNVMNMQNP